MITQATTKQIQAAKANLKLADEANGFKITGSTQKEVYKLCRQLNALDKGIDPESKEARKGSRRYWQVAFNLIRNEHIANMRKDALREIAEKAKKELHEARLNRQKAIANKGKRVKLTLKRNPVTA